MCFYSGAFHAYEMINLQFGSFSMVSGNFLLIAKVVTDLSVGDK